jgi:L-fuconolactonase
MLQITDTHQHLWDLERLNLPWVHGVPVLNQSFRMSDYQNAAEGIAICRTVYMEVDAHADQKQQEIDDITPHCQDSENAMQSLVCSADPSSSRLKQFLDDNAKNPYLKGVRQVLHNPEILPGHCRTSEFVKGVRELGRRGLLFDICIRPAELPDVVELCRQVPETTFILDHCGNPDPYIVNGERQPTPSSADSDFGHTREDWLAALQMLGRFENVICKISGIIARAEEGWSVTTLAPTVNACLDAFGEDRVIFGGDWPVCTLGASLSQWISVLREIIADRSQTAQEKLFHLNAGRLYRLD